jgi:hypothetical protein
MHSSIDIDLLVHSLKKRGHMVTSVIPVPDNAGEYEFVVDGNTLSLAETRAVLERDQAEAHPSAAPPKAATP